MLDEVLAHSKRVGERLETTLDDGAKVIFRRDIGNQAHPIGNKYPDPVDHYNIEVHSPIPGRVGRFRQIEDAHIILDKNGKPIDIIRNGRN